MGGGVEQKKIENEYQGMVRAENLQLCPKQDENEYSLTQNNENKCVWKGKK